MAYDKASTLGVAMRTIEEINAMTPEQQKAETNRLAKKALGNMLLIHAVKWTLIIGTTRALRKALEKNA